MLRLFAVIDCQHSAAFWTRTQQYNISHLNSKTQQIVIVTSKPYNSYYKLLATI